MHPMMLERDRIQSELQRPTEQSNYERMKAILSQYRGKDFRIFRRQAITEHQQKPHVPFRYEAKWLKSLKVALHAKNRELGQT